MLEFKSAYKKIEIKVDDKKKEMTAYANITNYLDDGDDIIKQGSFKKTISENKKRIKALRNHDFDKIIGIPEHMEEDSKGLLTVTKFVDTPLSNETYVLAKTGALNEMSIGYNAIKYGFENINNKEARVINEVKLWEYSIVTWGMNDKSKITNVKNLTNIENNLHKMIENDIILDKENINKFENILKELKTLINKYYEPLENTPKIEKSLLDADLNDKDISKILNAIEKIK